MYDIEVGRVIDCRLSELAGRDTGRADLVLGVCRVVIDIVRQHERLRREHDQRQQSGRQESRFVVQSRHAATLAICLAHEKRLRPHDA
jgi:hypothetical protein